MPPKRTKREYRGSSCLRCHRLKVKCTRTTPCRNCTLAAKPCTYSEYDRKVSVSESYLKRLEAMASSTTQKSSLGSPNFRAADAPQPSIELPATRCLARTPTDPMVENTTTELFVSKLRQIQKRTQIPTSLGTPWSSTPFLGQNVPTDGNKSELDNLIGEEGSSSQLPTYEYFALNSDTTHAKCTFQLPPYRFTVHLLDRFATYLGYDWHFFLIQRFRQRVYRVYMTADPAEARDRLWLSELLVTLSLGSMISDDGPEMIPQFSHSPDGIGRRSNQHNLPGVHFIEQALGLLKVQYENVSADHVETLNLMALGAYCLNRQKTAYMYAGISARFCNMLRLHKTATATGRPPVEREHWKRLWWSTFCIDRMTSTQMGVLPTLQIDQTDLSYPSSAGLLAGDLEELSDPDMLTARVQLTVIQTDAMQEANKMMQIALDDQGSSQEYIDSCVWPMVRRLESWLTALPSHMALEKLSASIGEKMLVSNSITSMAPTTPTHVPMLPFLRALANLHLRFNQCMILLLRPLLLRQIADIVSGMCAQGEAVLDLNNHCLASARTNISILLDIRSSGLLVQRGFMENVHLFCSLIVLRLAITIGSQRPHSFNNLPDDVNNYNQGKAIMQEMIDAGSLAAKGHMKLLRDVESLCASIVGDTSQGKDVSVESSDWYELVTSMLDAENGTGLMSMF